MTFTFQEFALRILVAIALAAILGLERGLKGKPIGLRAFMMVSLGSCAFTMITLNFAFGTMVFGDASVGVDPTRVIQGIIGGIGFLGAGALMSRDSDGHIRGMGTGSAIWTVGAVGVACGFGFFLEAGFVTLVALLILVLSSWVEDRAKKVTPDTPEKEAD